QRLQQLKRRDAAREQARARDDEQWPLFFSRRRRHTTSVSAFLLNRSSDLKPLQLKLLTTYIPKTSAFTLAFSTSQRLRTTRASARTFFTFRHYITPSARNF